MSPVWMLQDAKNAFSEVVNRACSSGPQIVTRRGRPVAVVISYENYSEQKSRGESFVDFLGSAQLEDGELDLSRSRDVGRTVAL
jgi:prevent-host-death family protein